MINVVKEQGWISLIDGFYIEFLLRLYNSSFLSRRFLSADYVVSWIAYSWTVFLKIRMRPSISHVIKWIGAGAVHGTF